MMNRRIGWHIIRTARRQQQPQQHLTCTTLESGHRCRVALILFFKCDPVGSLR